MSRHEPQETDPNPTGIGAGVGLLLGAFALIAGLLHPPSVRADTAGQSVEQTSPLDEERAAKKAAAEAAANNAPDPAPVPEPPEQASDGETLIELPIAPAGSRQDESEEALAPVTGPSDGIAVVTDGADELRSLRVLFPEDGIGIDAAAESNLMGLAGYLNDNQAQRVVLHAHAGDSGQGSSHARRLSLSRALAIRSFLVERGVPVDRIYLRPMGNEAEDGPPDRVDILPLRP